MLCSTCSKNQETLTAWVIHLATYHPLPVEWLSEKAKLLTDNENQRPYTVVTDSRKRRRRPTTPRPLNTFMIFSRHIRRNILSVFPDASNSQLSKELGMLWKNISEDVKSQYEEEAKRLAQLHALEFPDYKYQPKKRVQRYARPMRERQPSTIEGSNSTCGTDEENVKDSNIGMQDRGKNNDVENQYIRYSILGKNILKKECQSFISPVKNENFKLEATKSDYILSQPNPKPLNDRMTNYDENSTLLRQPRLPQYNSTLYLLPSENLVVNNSGTIASQELGEDYCREFYIINDFSPENVNIDDEIDITGNIFSNELDFEWPDMDENCKQDILINTLFQQ